MIGSECRHKSNNELTKTNVGYIVNKIKVWVWDKRGSTESKKL